MPATLALAPTGLHYLRKPYLHGYEVLLTARSAVSVTAISVEVCIGTPSVERLDGPRADMPLIQVYTSEGTCSGWRRWTSLGVGRCRGA